MLYEMYETMIPAALFINKTGETFDKNVVKNLKESLYE